MASVKVAVRVRPLNRREMDLRCSMIIQMEDSKTFITNTKLPSSSNDTLGRERVKQFTYDHCYWSAIHADHHYVSQEKVFEDIGYDVVQSAYEGYNACIFAYGQTGSGKTYTMMGDEEDYGLIPRICKSLFSEMSDPGTTYRTEVSYLEIYNERVRDLLREKKGAQQNLKVREHPKEGPYVQDLSKHLVVDYHDIQELIDHGNVNRTTAATSMNDQSSRSHAIFTIVFTQAKFNGDIPSEIHSKIHLVDLAGSERADASGATGERLKEGGSINKSLVTLGNVISTLADLSDKFAATPRRSVFIPYRDSVLTWLLKDSLGGNSKTVMIATISPADCNYGETLSTLRYANRAKKIVNKPTVNEDPNVKLIRELQEENAQLRALLGTNWEVLPSMKEFAETREKLNRNEEKVRQLTERWTGKWQETANVLHEHKTLALRKEGTGVVLDSELPYLLAIDDNILSTGMRLYHLKEGDTRVGREDARNPQDIVLSGPHVEAEHCIIRHVSSEVLLVPLRGALSSVNNVRVHESTKLSQGSVIRLGRHHIFRFNHPGEAAKLREEMKGTGHSSRNTWPPAMQSQLVKVWQDFQWAWSPVAASDSGVDSEFDVESSIYQPFDELDELEEKRKLLERLEEEHVLAEAQRLAELAKQEAERERLQLKEVEIQHLAQEATSMKQKAQKAQVEIHKLSINIDEQIQTHLREQERFIEERESLDKLKERLERDKERARHERQKLRKKRELDKARIELEQERQAEEWAQLAEEKKLFKVKEEHQRSHLDSQKEHTQKMRQIETSIYQNNMADMRDLVEAEVREMRRLAGLGELDIDTVTVPFVNLSPDDNDDLDIEQLKLKVTVEGPVIPLTYLQESKSLDTVPEEQEAEEQGEQHDGGTGEEKGQKESKGMMRACSIPPEVTASNLDDHLRGLADQVHEIHLKVCGSLQTKYSSVLSCDDHTSGLGQKVIDQFSAIKPLFEQLEKLAAGHKCKMALELKLKDFDRILTVVDKLIQIHEVLQVINQGIRTKTFLQAIENLDAVHNLLSSLEAEEQIERNVQKVLQTEVCIMREKLLYELGETWNRTLKWTLPPESRKLVDRPRTVTLEVLGSAKDKAVLATVAQAMHSVNMLESRLKTLCRNILEGLVEGVVTDRNTLLQVIDEEDRYTLNITLNPAGFSKKRLVPPAEAFQKLEQVFSFLHRPLCDIAVHDAAGRGQVTLTEKLGLKLSKDLFETVYKECLSQAVPHVGGQWEKYNEMVRLTERFQDALLEMDFLAPGQASLLDYLNNVNTLFANIKSQEILKKAHQFMTQELMYSVQISTDFPLGKVKRDDVEVERERFVRHCREEAGTHNYKLPTCQISVPVRSLMCLAYDTLTEGVATSNEGALNLCHSVRSMFELYCDVVPTYHREKLSTLHILAALHHNNCMFVAHHLITIDKIFSLKLARGGASSSSSSSTAAAVAAAARDPPLSELVQRVRRMGNESFSEHIQLKKEQLNDHLCEEGFTCIADDRGENATRAVKRMLHHLKHISAIWRDVLPTTVYCRAIGTLLHSALVELIDSVLSIEEFSADDCEYLQSVLNEIVDFGPEYFTLEDAKFTPQVALHEFVPCWLRFKELVLILSYGLQEVADRWADGKGPLAMHFTGEEVKKLVVGMFENTSKRDALISQLSRRPSVHLT